MTTRIKFLSVLMIVSFFSCEKNEDSVENEGVLLDGLIRVEALLSITDAEFKRTHPVVGEMQVMDDVYITFDSRDGNINVGQNNELVVDIDYTGFGGAVHTGSLEVKLKKSGDSYRLDFEGNETEETSTVTTTYAFKVENVPHTRDEISTDVSTWRYLEFELNGKEVCDYLGASNIPNSSINPIYIWDSSLSFKDELTKCDCEGESRIKVTMVFDAS